VARRIGPCLLPGSVPVLGLAVLAGRVLYQFHKIVNRSIICGILLPSKRLTVLAMSQPAVPRRGAIEHARMPAYEADEFLMPPVVPDDSESAGFGVHDFTKHVSFLGLAILARRGL